MGAMECIMFVYPKSPDTSFDMDYYTSSHLPMVGERLGENCTGWGVMDDTTGQYHALAWLIVKDRAEFDAALATHEAEVMGDIPNYTTVQPTMIAGSIKAASYDT